MKEAAVILILIGLLFFLKTSASGQTLQSDLIDDFSGNSSALGTTWQGFTDRVMGGISDMQSGIRSDGTDFYLRMSGQVSLENNGGFIQVRLMLHPDQIPVDLSRYNGLELKVRGKGNSYYIFLRTRSTRFPWKFYLAPIPGLESEWQTVRIPWTAFKKGDFGTMPPFSPRYVTSLAIVAYKKAFSAEIEVSEIRFY